MNIEGTYTLQASPEQVWQCLKDKELLLQTIPGLVRFAQAEKDTYDIALQIQHAPLVGIYSGQAHITEQLFPYYYHITLTGTGDENSNTISGNCGVHLHEQNDNTIITYTGTLTFSKQGARLSPLVVKGAAKLLLQQFFTALTEQLRSLTASPSIETEELPSATSIKQPGGDIIILPHVSPAPTKQADTTETLSATIARFLGLGAGDPVEEERWANRVRRISILSGLLLLVWIGTRLPGRK